MTQYTATVEVTYDVEILVSANTKEEAERRAHEMVERGQFKGASFLGSNVRNVVSRNQL